MADVVLTGASGFVGRAVLAELRAQGAEVLAVARRADAAARPGVRWLAADLLTPEGRAAVLGQRAPILIHAAWYVEHGAFWQAPDNALWLDASADLCQRAMDAGTRIAAFGTCAEYAAEEPAGLWPENRALAPATPYGQAKAALFAQLPDALWLRLFHLYGPGEAPARFVPALVQALARGQPAEVRAADLVRDFCSVAHAARATVALVAADASGAVNLGSGHAAPLGDHARVLAEALGRPELLRLSTSASADQPPMMAPDLTRARALIGDIALEDAPAALAAFARSQAPARG